MEKLPSYIKGLCHKRHKHVTKPWNKDPGTWANHDGSCHVSGFVSRWWACFLGFSYPLEGTRRRFSEALLGYVILFGVDFVNPYCEHEIQFTTWKTAVAVSFHELTPITSKPVTWKKWCFQCFPGIPFLAEVEISAFSWGKVLEFEKFYTVFRSSVIAMANQPTPLTFSPQKYGFDKCSAGY